jgi:NADPH:quinone reductase
MLAWLSTAPGLRALSMVTQPRPHAGAGQALVKVEAAALNFSDVLMIDDRYQVRPPRPFVPGQEIAGQVIEIGEGCALKVGQRVTAKVSWGGFAEYALLRSDMAIVVPDDVVLHAAVTLPVTYTTAMVSLSECTQVTSGEQVLVLAAAGALGLASVEIAHVFGARVIAAVGGPEKFDVPRAHGADEVIDYRAGGWSKTVKSLTNGHGVDVIVDPVGGDATKEALRAIAWGGRLLIEGFASGDIPAIPANRLLLNRAAAIGVYWNHDRDGAMLARVTARLTKLLQSGAIRPHIDKTFSFDELPQALAALSERRTTGKLILAPPSRIMTS